MGTALTDGTDARPLPETSIFSPKVPPLGMFRVLQGLGFKVFGFSGLKSKFGVYKFIVIAFGF